MLRLFNRQLQGVPASTNTQTVISPLDIPEVLEHIFSYLDKYTIRRSVAQVCRQWRLLNHHCLIREVTWYQNWSSSRKKRALSKLLGAGQFHYYHVVQGETSSSALTNLFDKHVLNALKRLESEYRMRLPQQTDLQTNTLPNNSRNNSIKNHRRLSNSIPTIYDFTPLREMHIYLASCGRDTFESLCFPSSLTTITIKVCSSYYARCDLGLILQSCPMLEHFSAEGLGLPVYTTMFLHLGLTLPISSSQPPPPSLQAQQISFTLRSLVLSNLSLEQPTLESLLPFTPRLKELKLIGIFCFQTIQQYNWTQLVRSLERNNITLDKAHFSIFGHRISAENTEMLWMHVYSHSSRERSFWARDITPQLLQTVSLQPETLTTLEILWRQNLHSAPWGNCSQVAAAFHQIIHRYLCDTPSLVHLTTLKTVVRLEDLDVFNRRGYTNLDTRQDPTAEEQSQDSSTSPPLHSIWRCRRLNTLHIMVHLFGPDKDQRQINHPIFTRILFGYISRVCPLLEDLQIGFIPVCHAPGSNNSTGDYNRSPPALDLLQLHLRGGLCLLGRLKYLRTLRVHQEEKHVGVRCEDWELNWMLAAPSGWLKGVRSSMKRRLDVDSWQDWMGAERRVEAGRHRPPQQGRLSESVASSNSNANDSGDSNHSSAIVQEDIHFQFRNLGLLLDVEEMVKEMEKFRPLPALERVSFNHPILLRPEEELERLFPS